MAESDLNPIYIDAFEEVNHAVIFFSKSKKVIWKNNIADRFFDIKLIQQLIARKEILKCLYEEGDNVFGISLPSVLDYPVSFSVIRSLKFDIYISTSISDAQANIIKGAIFKIINDYMSESADKLISACQIADGYMSSTNLFFDDRNIHKIRNAARDFNSNWIGLKKILGEVEFGLNSNSRLDVIEMTEEVIKKLKVEFGDISVKFFNHEYGVVYADFSLFVESLKSMIIDTLRNHDSGFEVVLSASQGGESIVWKWNSYDISSNISLRSAYLWGLCGGEIKRVDCDKYISYSATIQSGGVDKSRQAHLSLWVDNEIFLADV